MQSLTTDPESSSARKITFCHVYASLLDYFKVRFLHIHLSTGYSDTLFQGLMSSYMSFLLQPFIDILKEYSESDTDDKELWLCVVETLTKSLLSDEGGGWLCVS